MKPFNLKLPAVISLMGAAAFLLRFFLYLFGTDEKGLLVSGHPLEIALWLLTFAAAALVVLQVLKQTENQPYAVNFPGKVCPALGCFALAAGLLMTVMTQGFSFTALDRLRNVTGLLAVPCLIGVAVCRITGKRPFFGLHAVVCLALTLHTISFYPSWSSLPQLQDAFFPMMGCIGLMLFSYQQTALDADMGSRRIQLGAGLLAAFCCFAAAAKCTTPLLYLTGGFFALANLCAWNPATEKGEDHQ